MEYKNGSFYSGFRDNEKENGNYKSIIGYTYWGYRDNGKMETIIVGLGIMENRNGNYYSGFRDNGKENGNYYNGL